jgi:hypothetical protein
MVALGGVALFAALLAPTGVLLIGVIVTTRGFEAGLPRDGFVSWQTVAAVLMLIICGRCVTLRLQKGTWRPTRVDVWTIGFVGWLLLTSVPAGALFTAPLRLLPLAAFAVVYVGDERAERVAMRALVYVPLVEVLLSSGQLSTRLSGTHVGDPGQMGVLLLAGLAVVFGSTLHFRYPRLLALALLFGVLATRTRGVWFSLIVMVLIAIAPSLSIRRLVMLIGAVAVVGLLLLGPLTHALGLNPHSQTIRRESVVLGWTDALARPTFGTGWTSKGDPASFRASTTADGPDYRAFNVFVFLASVSGFPAALLFVALVGSSLVVARRRHLPAYLFLGAFCGVSLWEATIYPGSYSGLFFFVFLAFADKGVPMPRGVTARQGRPVPARPS